jgi:hypothetical protein
MLDRVIPGGADAYAARHDAAGDVADGSDQAGDVPAHGTGPGTGWLTGASPWGRILLAPHAEP